jgi:hypothetical protein
MNIVIAIAALAVSVFSAFGFWKAGKFKAGASKEVLLGAGMGWVKNLPMGIVRVVAWLEILGAVGVVLAPLTAYILPGFEWAQFIGVLAGAGLALTMLVAFIMHAVRGEAKYTWKINTQMFLVAVVATVLQALVTLPIF